MLNINASCYLRIPFQFGGDKTALNTLTLKIQYDDGFIAYLNGTEVARRNFVGDPTWNSAATVSRDNTAAAVFESIDISDQIGKLRPGDNILALQGLNAAANNSDFLFNVELAAVQTPVISNLAGRQAYTGPIPLTRTTRVKARITTGGVCERPGGCRVCGRTRAGEPAHQRNHVPSAGHGQPRRPQYGVRRADQHRPGAD